MLIQFRFESCLVKINEAYHKNPQSCHTHYYVSRRGNFSVHTFLYLCIERPRIKSNVKKCNKRQTINIRLVHVLLYDFSYVICDEITIIC